MNRREFSLALAASAGLSVCACATTRARAEQPITTIKLTEDQLGHPPRDFEFRATGFGELGRWTVVRDDTTVSKLAIEQVSREPTEDRFPLAIYSPISAKNVEVRVRFKILGGTMQSAGLAVRLISADEYYVARVSALEERIDLLRVVGGKPERIAGVDADVTLDRWQTLGLIAKGDELTVSLDHELVFTTWDKTFRNEGQIALWTEDDNVTRFEEIAITPLPWSRGE